MLSTMSNMGASTKDREWSSSKIGRYHHRLVTVSLKVSSGHTIVAEKFPVLLSPIMSAG